MNEPTGLGWAVSGGLSKQYSTCGLVISFRVSAHVGFVWLVFLVWCDTSVRFESDAFDRVEQCQQQPPHMCAMQMQPEHAKTRRHQSFTATHYTPPHVCV